MIGRIVRLITGRPRSVGRVRLSAEVRESLYQKQKSRCAGCQQKFYLQSMDVDHIRPLKRGGKNELKNFQLLCRLCNSIKGERSMREYRRILKRDYRRNKRGGLVKR